MIPTRRSTVIITETNAHKTYVKNPDKKKKNQLNHKFMHCGSRPIGNQGESVCIINQLTQVLNARQFLDADFNFVFYHQARHKEYFNLVVSLPLIGDKFQISLKQKMNACIRIIEEPSQTSPSCQL